MKMEKVLASACLCGIPCRWHGKKCYKCHAIRTIEDSVEIIPVCPEMLGGLPCPRPPVKTKKGRVYQTDHSRMFYGPDVTDRFEKGAQKVLNIARENNINKAYLFKLSPSCAPNGITGRLLRQHGIDVIPTW
jgi:uncharacterized protein YbbK (DUF523 family)